MLLAFLRARVGHLSVMAATRGGATAQREADMAANPEQKLKVYSLGMSETTAILDFLTEYGKASAMASEPRVSATTLDRISELVLTYGKSEPASAMLASGEAGDKQKHAHAEMYLVASEWEALRDIKVSVPNKVHQRLLAGTALQARASPEKAELSKSKQCFPYVRIYRYT